MKNKTPVPSSPRSTPGALFFVIAGVWSGLNAGGLWSAEGAQIAPKVTVQQLGVNRVRVAGQMLLAQPREIVWQVLTGYDHLSEFIPGLRESRLVTTSPERLLFQRGVVRWWIIRQTVPVTFRVEEVPGQAIRFAAISGDFLEHQGAWTVETANGRVRLGYEAVIRPRFWLPPLVGARLLRRQLRETLYAIADRAEAVSARTAATTP